MTDLKQLARLLQRRNEIDSDIATLVNRPAHAGHIGEYVAAVIFRIELHASAVFKASDGTFGDGPLVGKSVNIKYGTRRDGMLNLVHSTDPTDHPDYYLVLTGPAVGAISSVGLSAPWVIHAVYLFESKELVQFLTGLERMPGTATSIRQHLWDAAMVYPEPNNSVMTLTDEQLDQLGLFLGTDLSI